MKEIQILKQKLDKIEDELKEIKYALLPVEEVSPELLEELDEVENRIKSGNFADEKEIFSS